MPRYIAQRLLRGLLTAFIVSLILFAILRTTFDPLNFIMCTDDCEFTEEDLRELREEFGVHGPLHIQYLRWMGSWVTGDWGESLFSNEKIWESFILRLPITLQLVAIAQSIAVLVGMPAGVLMALKRSSWPDILGRAVSGMSLALPIFLTGTLLLVAGTYFLEWSPESNNEPIPGISRGGLILCSALALGLPATAAVALMVRSSTLDALRQDDVQDSSVSGPGRSTAAFLETLRYVSVPTAVILSLTFPAIVGGTVIMERIFALDGAGNMLFEAMNLFDYIAIESLALFFAVWVIAANTLVDILCGWLDPEARSTRKSPREEWNHLANPVRLV